MELIERYLNEVGRYLPRQNRKDILGEMRSALADALEDQAGENPTREQTIEMLRAFGEPRKVAARYYPEGQYLIGPTLYPLFRMVTGIALAAVLGAQIIAWLVAYFFAGSGINVLETSAGLVNSLPSTLGFVVIVFMILQRFDVRPDEAEKNWDPANLPAVDEREEVSRTERVVAIIFQSIMLAVLTWFSDRIGVYTFPGGDFFANPILPAFIPWMSLSLLVGIGLDVYLLWQGRWTLTGRLVRLGANLFGIVVLGLLSQAHYAWLQAHNAGTFLNSIETFAQNVEAGGQVIMVQIFWLAFSIALIVTIVETAVAVFKMLRKLLER